jgi:hypothetical protein
MIKVTLTISTTNVGWWVRRVPAVTTPRRCAAKVPANAITTIARETTNQGNRDAHSDGATRERLHAEACGQSDMPESGFTGIILPTGIGRKGNSRIER